MHRILTCLLAILASILTSILASTAEAQRYCSSPNCAMCNRLEAQWYAQLPKPAPEPKVSFEPSPMEVTQRALRIAAPKPGEVIYDLGCGDGRVLIHASQYYGIGGVGVELNKANARLARKNVEEAKLKNVLIVTQDATKLKLDKADIIYLYLFPDTIQKLDKTLADARIVISYCHDIPQLKTQRVDFVEADKKYTLYVYRKGT